MLPSRSSKGHSSGSGALSHQLGAWWQASTRSLHSKLIMLTVVVLLLSSLMLMHSIVSNWNAARGGTEMTQSNNEIMLSKTSEATLSAGSRQKKPGDVNLAPPLSRPVLGHASWAMLHTMAALFPEEASLTKQAAMISFLTAMGELYPCATCARHFRLFMSQHPLPALGQLHRDSLSKWLCAAHNGVNARTDKPLQDCALIADLWPSKLEQDCGCDAEEEPSTKTKDAAGTIDPAAAAASIAQSNAPITDLATLRRAIDAQSARDARGKHKAAMIEEEERDKAAAAAEEERRKARERELGAAAIAAADPAKLIAART